jgi:hypothetical protein
MNETVAAGTMEGHVPGGVERCLIADEILGSATTEDHGRI